MTTATQRHFYIVFALLFAVGMHYYQYNYGGVGLTMPFNLMTWCFASVLIGLALWHCTITNTINYSSFLVILSVFVVSLFLPILYGKNELLIYSSQRFIGLLAGLIFLFSLYQINLSSTKLNKLVLWILIGVIIEGLICFTQQYIFSDSVWLQHAPHTRPSGILQQPNVISTFFTMSIALSAFLLASTRERTKLELYTIYLASILAGWMIILNTSKTATISLFIVLMGTAPLLYCYANKTHLQRWYASILIGLSIPFILNTINSDFTPKEIVENIRPTLYLISLSLIGTNLLTGTGYGSFSPSFHQAQATYIANNEFSSRQFANNAGHPHNEFLLWGVEGGILPLITMALLSLYICYRYLSLGWKKGLFCLAILFPAVFHSMTELPFYHATIVFITFIFTIYLIEKSYFDKKTTILPRCINFRLSAFLIPFITIIFMASGLHTLNKLHEFEQNGLKESQYLQEIINPVSIVNGIEYTWFLAPLISKKNDPNSIHYFISETEKLLKHWPRAKLYKDLATAYQIIGNQELSYKYYREGQRLFPYSDEFKTNTNGR